MEFTFSGKIELWNGSEAWHFIQVPKGVSAEIREISEGLTRGFGSVRVDVQIGSSNWRTSIFPDGKLGTFGLPVKKEVRKAENLKAGSKTSVFISLVDF